LITPSDGFIFELRCSTAKPLALAESCREDHSAGLSSHVLVPCPLDIVQDTGHSTFLVLKHPPLTASSSGVLGRTAELHSSTESSVQGLSSHVNDIRAIGLQRRRAKWKSPRSALSFGIKRSRPHIAGIPCTNVGAPSGGAGKASIIM